MKPDAVTDRCTRCSQSEDDLLLDAEAAAKALMANAAEVYQLRARVKELEADLRVGVELWDGKWHGDEFWRRRANWLNSVCAKLRAADALHRPPPSQERP